MYQNLHRIMIEEPVVEQVNLMKRLEQIRLDEELAFKLQAKEERLAREKAQQIKEANIAWDDVQAKSKEENILQLREQKRRGIDHQQELNKGISCEDLFDYKIELGGEKSSKKEETDLEENLKKAIAEVMEGSSKRAGEELEQESIKKQKVDKDKETVELQSLIKVISDEEREDLEDLYKLVKAKYGSTRPVEDLDLILYGDLKTMFEPHVKDQVWKNQG
ncbi:hypothetical protein Tco_1125040 [Tanacetum coccineum]|uniref:Uncharacterized protein n=1 Tax=Tanacetum coccineum TaxID=301880 RepID=A0ABQ5J7V3_9ASTR